MENKEEQTAGVTVRGDEAPENFHVAPRTENSTQFAGPTVQATAAAAAETAPPASMAMSSPGTGSEAKKKRGRPRKYGPDGTLSMALSPMPISSSIPLTGEFSAWKRGRGRPTDTMKKSFKYEYEGSGLKIAYSVGVSFTPHIITVNAGEDVTMKIMSFSQQASCAVCILAANGTIASVAIRHPTSSGGTLMYEGRFEIISLCGSYLPADKGGTKSRTGGMSVCLSGPDGRVIGGGLAGLLIAAGPVQGVVGSFLPGHHQEQKQKKQKTEPTVTITPATVNAIPAEDLNVSYGVKPIPAASNLSFPGANAAPTLKPLQGLSNPTTTSDNKTSSPEEESKDHSPSNCEVSS